MGIRETLNEKPGLTTAVTAGVVVLALIYIVYSVWPSNPSARIAPSQAYFTSDLGKTYQAKPADALYALDDAGKADNVRAWVFKWPDQDQPFVAFLERVSPDLAKQHNETQAGDKPVDPMQLLMAEGSVEGHYVARPGEDSWFDKSSPQGQQIAAFPQRDGKYAMPVDPK